MAWPDSDIDVIVIVDDQVRYLETSVWLECFGRLRAISTENWGLLQSRRAHYVDGTEVEFGITVRSWARIDPVDPGIKTLSQAECSFCTTGKRFCSLCVQNYSKASLLPDVPVSRRE